ncbi:unnamed protein product [Cyclocybe aegerita]|uniref:Uncharacterized protein n=1 Tax=Cyclocybe aegerita TaxID=1973307 RepID=A0A8S0VSI7_CYCAE|nr:unnamed protein product [Cyclocybe aegerita]
MPTRSQQASSPSSNSSPSPSLFGTAPSGPSHHAHSVTTANTTLHTARLSHSAIPAPPPTDSLLPGSAPSSSSVTNISAPTTSEQLCHLLVERPQIADRLLVALDANSVEQPALCTYFIMMHQIALNIQTTDPYDPSLPQNNHPHPTTPILGIYKASPQSNSLKAQESSCTLSRLYDLYSDEPNTPPLLSDNSKKEPDKNENKDRNNNKCIPRLRHTSEGQCRIHHHHLWRWLPLEESMRSVTPDVFAAIIVDNLVTSSSIATITPVLTVNSPLLTTPPQVVHMPPSRSCLLIEELISWTRDMRL